MSIHDLILVVFYALCQITVIFAREFALTKESLKVTVPELRNGSLNYKIIYCNPRHQDCCEKGHCSADSLPELTLQVGSNGRLSPFVWFLVFLISVGYVYFCLRYCFKKLYRRRSRTSAVTISRANTQPQELSLMLSFNQNRESLQRFNFDHMNGSHLHVPFMPTTPVTPPPAYVTLTPPPTYNVAIHFPSVRPEKIVEENEENEEEVKDDKK